MVVIESPDHFKIEDFKLYKSQFYFSSNIRA